MNESDMKRSYTIESKHKGVVKEIVVRERNSTRMILATKGRLHNRTLQEGLYGKGTFTIELCTKESMRLRKKTCTSENLHEVKPAQAKSYTKDTLRESALYAKTLHSRN